MSLRYAEMITILCDVMYAEMITIFMYAEMITILCDVMDHPCPNFDGLNHRFS